MLGLLKPGDFVLDDLARTIPTEKSYLLLDKHIGFAGCEKHGVYLEAPMAGFCRSVCL